MAVYVTCLGQLTLRSVTASGLMHFDASACVDESSRSVISSTALSVGLYF